MSKLDSQFQWKFPGENLLEKLQIVIFWKSSGKVSAGCPKNVSGAFKLLPTSPWEQFEENNFEKLLHFLWSFFGCFAVIQREKISWPLKTAFSLSIEILFKKTFGKQMKFLIIFRHLAEVSGLFSFLGRFVGTAFYVSIGTLYRKTMFFRTYTFPFFLDK